MIRVVSNENSEFFFQEKLSERNKEHVRTEQFALPSLRIEQAALT